MANYYPASRTNYFKVENVEAFKEDMSKLSGDFEIWDSVDKNNNEFVALGGYEGFIEVYDEEQDDYVDIAPVIQKHIESDEACIIIETGHEKLRYLVGQAYVITKNKSEFMDLGQLAIQKARELLGNSDKSFNMHY